VTVVLDASAVLALLFDEPGADIVAERIAAGATISTVNLSEVATILVRHGRDPDTVLDPRRAQVDVLAFSDVDAIATAKLYPLVSARGLSLGDRACLALARRLDAGHQPSPPSTSGPTSTSTSGSTPSTPASAEPTETDPPWCSADARQTGGPQALPGSGRSAVRRRPPEIRRLYAAKRGARLRGGPLTSRCLSRASRTTVAARQPRRRG